MAREKCGCGDAAPSAERQRRRYIDELRDPEPANFVGRLIAIRSLSRRRVRHRHPAVEADREPQSCRRRAESRRASAANKYSIASMHAPSRTEAHRGGTGPAFGSGLTGPHRMTATAGRFDS
ncbi:hypothetical protein [Burkholderia pseudomallei]|uniref:hypothetical protein n=1 Tax=Burkholderia pseudomallei TaxID=28450 RepID=UPI001605059E|nr:hypothetical protein [Burkholderia pseudomallei]MBF3572384.1 hypothetical protein [Burkholderia pseudomallei]MBF3696260.1 hypothetical protein [Burkholderia pseudomallei]